ncbi:MAG TPA: beta-N-acetylhexosaminidase, partial [Symbiobacteriaceae bacterium]|nr:beta-N-acetylhexosaminidase [Symbiobacteriaceae bacterium]
MKDPRALVQAMSLEEKAAQMIFLGFKETELPERVAAFIEKNGLGGIILFTRNVKSPEQTLALTTAAQKAAKRSRQGMPLAISIDQEGGTVTRMGEEAGYTHFPGNMALGAADDPTLTYRAARTMAAEMRAVGINWNLAPVLDVNNNAMNPVIGVRSYGAAPELVGRHGSAAVKGYQDGYVAACGKHFPGHGDTAVDSHLALPVIPHDRARLEAVEFAPFREAIKAGLDSMMTAHVFFPALEPTPGLPATLSKNVMTGLLREEMGFDGVISTDCLEMKAIADNFTPEQTVQLCVEAGVDALLVSHTWNLQMAMYEALLKLVREGKISEERVAESAVRIVRMKLARKMDQFLPADLGSSAHHNVALEVARKAMTVAWGAEHLPLSGKVMLVLPRVVWFAQVEDSRTVLAKLLEGLTGAGLAVDAIDCPLTMDGVDVDELTRRAGPGGTVVFGAAGVGRNPRQA